MPKSKFSSLIVPTDIAVQERFKDICDIKGTILSNYSISFEHLQAHLQKRYNPRGVQAVVSRFGLVKNLKDLYHLHSKSFSLNFTEF